MFRAISNDIHISISTREKLRSKIQVYIYMSCVVRARACIYIYICICVSTYLPRFLFSRIAGGSSLAHVTTETEIHYLQAAFVHPFSTSLVQFDANSFYARNSPENCTSRLCKLLLLSLLYVQRLVCRETLLSGKGTSSFNIVTRAEEKFPHEMKTILFRVTA